MPLDRLGFLLKHAYLKYMELSDAAYEPLGVTARECGILSRIAAADGVSQLELAADLGVDRTTMTQLLDALESRGLVRRSPNPRDRRKNVLGLTDEGARILGKDALIHSDVERRFLASLDPRRREDFRSALLDLASS